MAVLLVKGPDPVSEVMLEKDLFNILFGRPQLHLYVFPVQVM